MADDIFADLVGIRPSATGAPASGQNGTALGSEDTVLPTSFAQQQPSSLAAYGQSTRVAKIPPEGMGSQSRQDRASGEAEVLRDFEKVIERFTAGVQQALEDTNRRLESLENRTEQIARGVADLQEVGTARTEGVKARLSSLEKAVREVQRGVQLVRDRQELADAQADLASLARSTQGETGMPQQAVKTADTNPEVKTAVTAALAGTAEAEGPSSTTPFAHNAQQQEASKAAPATITPPAPVAPAPTAQAQVPAAQPMQQQPPPPVQQPVQQQPQPLQQQHSAPPAPMQASEAPQAPPPHVPHHAPPPAHAPQLPVQQEQPAAYEAPKYYEQPKPYEPVKPYEHSKPSHDQRPTAPTHQQFGYPGGASNDQQSRPPPPPPPPHASNYQDPPRFPGPAFSSGMDSGPNPHMGHHQSQNQNQYPPPPPPQYSAPPSPAYSMQSQASGSLQGPTQGGPAPPFNNNSSHPSGPSFNGPPPPPPHQRYPTVPPPSSMQAPSFGRSSAPGPPSNMPQYPSVGPLLPQLGSSSGSQSSLYPPRIPQQPPPPPSRQDRPSSGPQVSSQTRNVPLEQVIDDVANMGFSRHEVKGVVLELMDKGQSVDLNIVLDRLMHGRR